MMMKPEILSPAGNLFKLKLAVRYGADAVYCSGLKYGLRQASENFTFEELKDGIDFAHSYGSKVYVVLNGHLHEQDFEHIDQDIKRFEELGVDAFIISDLGVLERASHSRVDLHLSTQASCVNHQSALFWKKMGVTRLVLGRECSIEEALQIKKESGLEIEMFVHGSMCMAFSGHCVISNFTQGRDSNRGGCAHSCRFQYRIEGQSDSNQASDQEKRLEYFMSSKDLRGIEHLERFWRAGIDSLKIEGRMKGPLYAATTSHAYRFAMDLAGDEVKLQSKELEKLSHRSYADVNLITKADQSTVYQDRMHDEEYVLAGLLKCVKNHRAYLEVKSKFFENDELEVLHPKRSLPIKLKVKNLTNLSGDSLEFTRPSTLVQIDWHPSEDLQDQENAQCEIEDFVIRQKVAREDCQS